MIDNTFLLALMLGGSVTLLFYGAITFYWAVTRPGGPIQLAEGQKPAPLLIRGLLPFARPFATMIREHNQRVAGRRGAEAADTFLISLQNKLLRALISAGRPGGLEPPEVLGLVAGTAFIGAVLGAGGHLLTGWSLPLMIAGGALVGAGYPTAWFYDAYQTRRRDLRRALPFALDLLTLSVEAGLDFTSAIARIVRRLGDAPLGLELGELLRTIQMGQTRAQALRDLAWRVNLVEVNSVSGALIQADELGASLSPILRMQADQLRVRRAQRAEEQAMKTPVKILFPLVAFIFPTTFLIIIGPLLVHLWPQIGVLFGGS